MRGTGFVARNELQLTNIINLPSGRGMVAKCVGITLSKIYAPSGTAKQERENFYNTELLYLWRNVPDNLILVGYFNCVLEAADATGHYTYSRALATLVQGYSLRDMWTQPQLGMYIPITHEQERPV
jgi:exonuclease III